LSANWYNLQSEVFVESYRPSLLCEQTSCTAVPSNYATLNCS